MSRGADSLKKSWNNVTSLLDVLVAIKHNMLKIVANYEVRGTILVRPTSLYKRLVGDVNIIMFHTNCNWLFACVK